MLNVPIVACSENYLPDEPGRGRDELIGNVTIDSYTQALDIWKTAEDINQWVAGSFTYDRPRAIALSSNRKSANTEISIYKPSEFFDTKAGVCVDLARFGVETLNKIAPERDPKYLMIEFKPVQINGNIFRLHWLVSFKKGGKYYFFCDSKRPGFMAGPYDSTQVFINDYEKYRGRQIVAYRELDSFKKKKQKSKKQKSLSKK